MNYKYSYLDCESAATKIIDEEYEANRLEDLQRVRELQSALQFIDPRISNILLMAMVNVLFRSKE